MVSTGIDQELKKARTNGNKKREGSNNKNQSANRSRKNASQAKNRIQEKIDTARNAVRTSVKSQIILGGVGDALNDIAEGNFNDIELDAIAALDSFAQGWEETSNNLIEAEVKDDLFLLSSSSSFCRNENKGINKTSSHS